jgi:hypothetical protein
VTVTVPALDLARFTATPLEPEPFPHLIVPGFLSGPLLDFVERHYPAIDRPGSFPVEALEVGAPFVGFLDALRGPAMRAAFAAKFAVDLDDLPTMITLRGRARATDGKIHTDSRDKVITVLIYLNGRWEAPGGRLRLLRSPAIEDVLAEVPPDAGTLLAFRRSDNSWHGHLPFEGPRRAIQLNWVSDAAVVTRERRRHMVSAALKRLNPFAAAGR